MKVRKKSVAQMKNEVAQQHIIQNKRIDQFQASDVAVKEKIIRQKTDLEHSNTRLQEQILKLQTLLKELIDKAIPVADSDRQK
jgi:hypothetical protein